jgi:pilus assembly protein Flp/PilA
MTSRDLAGPREQRGPQGVSSGTARVNQEWRMRELIRILRCERGANAIEYALVASLIAIAALVAMGNLGNKIDSMFNNVSSAM